MAVNPVYFNPLSFQQANPIVAGMQAGSDIMANAYRNAYMQQQTQGQQIQNQWMPQMNQADIALKAAQGGYYGAESQQALADANLIRQKTPFEVQQSQLASITDPTLRRLAEINMAQKTGVIPSNLLGMIGFGNASQSPQPTQSPNGLTTPAGNASPAANPLTAPKLYNGDAATNFALFGSPYNPIAMKSMETAATTGVTQYNDAQKDAAQSANLGNQLSQLVNQFQTNYAKSTYKGPAAGTLPSSGRWSAFVPGNLGPEQATDNASQNLAATVAKLIAGGRVTNYEMQYINNLKPNRTMTPDTAQMTSDFLKQKSLRMEEQQNFLNAARNQGIDVQTANSLWGMYDNQRPVYDFSQNKPNTQFQKSWSDYLTPQAVVATQTGQNYVPLPSFESKQGFHNWYKTLNSADQMTVRAELAKQGGQ